MIRLCRLSFVLALALLVPACALLGHSPVTPASVVGDVDLIASGLNNALPQLTGTIDPVVLGKVHLYIADLQVAADAVGTADTIAVSKPLVVRVESDVNAVVDAVAGLSLPEPFAGALHAATVLLPVVEVAVNLPVLSGASPGGVEAARATLLHASR